MMFRAKTNHRIDNEMVSGVSFSRDKKYAQWWAEQESNQGNNVPIIFELDRYVLTTTHKIVLFDIYSDGFFPEMARKESEEFVVGDIKLQNGLIKSIWMHQKDINSLSAKSPLYTNKLVKSL